MLDTVIATSLRHRTIVVVAALAVALLGLYRAISTPIDVLPDLDRPIVTVLTEAHGMSPEDVERLVTWPIEQVVNGASSVHRVRSSSGPGLSVVWVDFEWDTDIYRARQVVAEKLQIAAGDLPPEVRPTLAPISSIMGQVMVVGFRSRSGGAEPTELRRLVDRQVRPRILSLPGIAQVISSGGQPTQLQVHVDADRLRALDVTLAEVAEAVERSNVVVSGAPVAVGAQAPAVAVTGLLSSPEELSAAVVAARPPRPVRVGDVAEVELGPAAIRVGDAGIDGGPGVLLVISKQPGTDTVALTDRVERELALIADSLPGDIEIDAELFQQASFIERAIHNVIDAVRDGGALVVIVLALFLFNLRTTLITLSAIPLSIAVTALVFTALGLTINTMTLGGLAVAIGTLVDDAIVDVENVFRRLHENSQERSPRPALDVVFRASCEVRKPVVYGTLLVTVVYLPLFFLSGIEGRLFAPIGLAYVVSVAASLLVALTVTPALCYLLLGSTRASSAEYGGWLVRTLRRFASIAAERSVRHVNLLTAVAAISVLATPLLLSKVGSTFLPPFNEGSAQVNLILPPSTGLGAAVDFGRRLEQRLLEVEGVASVARRTGRAEGDEHVMPVSTNEVILSFDDPLGRSRGEVMADIREVLEAHFPGVASETEQPLAHLLSHLLSGVTAQVAIKVAGPELPVLRELAAQVEAAVSGVAGVTDLYTEPQVLVPQLRVDPDRTALARRGIDVQAVAETVELATGGRHLTRFQEGRAAYDTVVQLEEADRAKPAQLAGLTLRREDGSLVRLDEVAAVSIARTPNNIDRENVERRVVVRHNVAGRSLGEVVDDVEAALEPIRASLAERPGYSIRTGGQFEAQQSAQATILGLSGVSLALMIGILRLHFRSLRLALLVLLTRPVALTGSAIAVILTGQSLSIASLVGFIAMLGMATRNAILLVDHTAHLAREGEDGLSLGDLRRAAAERVVPVLMTALTSGIGLVPLALAPDRPGRELLYPVATVIIGGLVTNTLLDLLLTPGLLWHLARRELGANRLPDPEAVGSSLVIAEAAAAGVAAPARP